MTGALIGPSRSARIVRAARRPRGTKAARAPLTFSQECAKLLRDHGSEMLDLLVKHLRADLLAHRFVAMPRWHMHDFLLSAGAERYVELAMGDQMRAGNSSRQFLNVALSLTQDDPAKVSLQLRIEVFELEGPANCRTEVAELKRATVLAWPSPSLWDFLWKMRCERSELIEQFRSQLLAAQAP